VDVFSFMPRPQLAELVPQIGDWYFASKAQYFFTNVAKSLLAIWISEEQHHG
jgi:hypothetical protein